jgi:transcriptional regulator with XRE-family HTH domain
MKATAKKYQTQGSVSYPHIGQFLRQYFSKYGVNRAAVARELGVADSTTTRYMAQESLQFGILWKISVAINRNLLADLASRLPIAFATPREIALETELKALQEELNALKLENKIYKDLLK